MVKAKFIGKRKKIHNIYSLQSHIKQQDLSKLRGMWVKFRKHIHVYQQRK